jgi:hypothetical protein
MSRSKKSEHPVSDEFLVWAESLAGLLTTLETKHGGASAMIESRGWDQGRTQYALGLISDLAKHIERVRKEMSDHANEKPF